ncbi:MAG: hypothetical protein GC157_16430 [Frankiales bacterium]|nr:hypothetical protein [Frankiales bacterium]
MSGRRPCLGPRLGSGDGGPPLGHDGRMDPAAEREQARSAHDRRDWPAARDAFAAADAREPLGAVDLEAWGLAALLVGLDAESDTVRERAHHAFLGGGDLDGAARVAFWLGLALLMRGEQARAGGWFGRVRSVLGPAFEASVWRGYESVNDGMRALFAGEADHALAALGGAITVAERFDDTALRVLAGNGHGQALLALGESRRGLAELDEVMVLATTTPGVTPQAVGLVYCAVIAVCRECLDLTRSAEWTDVLSRWCEDQNGLVPYRGQCLVHRSEVMAMRGRWEAAAEEVRTVIDRLADVPGDAAAGMAHYQLGELHRLHGHDDAAEAAYRHALAAGVDPQPGLALLRLAQGRAATALLSVRRALDEVALPFGRTRLLPAAVEIALAAGDTGTAHALADELASAAAAGSPVVAAAAAQGRGAVALADGRPSDALGLLRTALQAWTALEAPYETARCRTLLARACDAVGDTETAELERAAARSVFAALDAAHDLAALDDGPAGADRGAAPAGLTPRELEVLRLVATGASNREVAERLVLSERTVARHMANIFLKLGVSSRSAATAFAFGHRLV